MNPVLLKTLLSTYALLIAIIVGEWAYANYFNAPKNFNSDKKKSASIEKLSTINLTAKSIDDYPDLVEQPLFIPSRKPLEDIPELATKKVVAKGNFNLMLTGIVERADNLTAFFEDRKSKTKANRHIEVVIGDHVHGWEVKKIEYNKVVIENNQQEKDIMLRADKKIKKTFKKYKKSSKTKKTAKAKKLNKP